MKYALIQNGVVTECYSVDPVTILPAAYAAQFVEVPDEVEQLWLLQPDGSFAAPPAPEPIPETVITKLAFLRRFTLPERMAIRASTDPVVQDFMYMLELAGDVTLDDPDSIAGLSYLEQQNLLATGRAAEILAC